MEAKDISLPVRIGVTTALAAATVAGAVVPEDKNVKTGAGVVGTLATLGYSYWAFKDSGMPDVSSYTPDNKTLTAVGVGVAATSLIATAMYFLGGREAPRLPSFGELTGAAEREIGFGSFETDLEKQRDQFAIARENARTRYANDPEKLRYVLDEMDLKQKRAEQAVARAEAQVAADRAHIKYANDPEQLGAALGLIDARYLMAPYRTRNGIGR